MTRAIILAAGVGERLGAGPDAPSKALLEFGGRTLLRRHIDILRAAGIGRIVVVTGYGAAAIEAALAEIETGGAVATLYNPDFRGGSMVSLAAAAAELRAGDEVLLMDADVLYDRRMIDRLLQSEHRNAMLLDRAFDPGDEPVKICLSGGRIVDFDKAPDRPGDAQGESVGFFKLDGEAARLLADRVQAHVAGDGRLRPHEHALRDLVLDGPPGLFGFEDVTGLPWTEIDFPDDVRRARDEILPKLIEP